MSDVVNACMNEQAVFWSNLPTAHRCSACIHICVPVLLQLYEAGLAAVKGPCMFANRCIPCVCA